MKCTQPELGDLFPFYLNGELRPDQERIIEDHLAHCTACQQELLFWVALAEQGLPAWKLDRRRTKPKVPQSRTGDPLLTRN